MMMTTKLIVITMPTIINYIQLLTNNKNTLKWRDLDLTKCEVTEKLSFKNTN